MNTDLETWRHRHILRQQLGLSALCSVRASQLSPANRGRGHPVGVTPSPAPRGERDWSEFRCRVAGARESESDVRPDFASAGSTGRARTSFAGVLSATTWLKATNLGVFLPHNLGHNPFQRIEALSRPKVVSVHRGIAELTVWSRTQRGDRLADRGVIDCVRDLGGTAREARGTVRRDEDDGEAGRPAAAQAPALVAEMRDRLRGERASFDGDEDRGVELGRAVAVEQPTEPGRVRRDELASPGDLAHERIGARAARTQAVSSRELAGRALLAPSAATWSALSITR